MASGPNSRAMLPMGGHWACDWEGPALSPYSPSPTTRPGAGNQRSCLCLVNTTIWDGDLFYPPLTRITQKASCSPLESEGHVWGNRNQGDGFWCVQQCGLGQWPLPLSFCAHICNLGRGFLDCSVLQPMKCQALYLVNPLGSASPRCWGWGKDTGECCLLDFSSWASTNCMSTDKALRRPMDLDPSVLFKPAFPKLIWPRLLCNE